MTGERWNSNLEAFGRLLQRLPAGPADQLRRGLDVGCGEGETTRRLRRHVDEAVGLDSDAASIASARAEDDDIDYRLGDLLDDDAVERLGGPFDVVTAVAVVHHVDHRAAFTRLRELVRPGGTLLVVGFARSTSIPDLGRDVADWIALRRHTLRRAVWETPSPKRWPPPLSYGEVRACSDEVLPGSRFERLPYLRYGLTWGRPPA